MSPRVGTPSTPDLGGGVERGQGVVPPAFQGRTHRAGFGVPGHDRDQATGRGAPAQLVDQRLRPLEVPEHAVAQHGREASTIHRLAGVQAVGLHERDPSLSLRRQHLESLPCLVQHRRRRIEQCHLVAGLGQRKRLMARTATDVQDRGRWLGQMLEQLVMQHVGAHAPLHRGIGLIGKQVGQLGPGVIAHDHQHTHQPRGPQMHLWYLSVTDTPS